LVNATPYGLTSGLCSLDEREQVRWAERVHAGNLYINRPITGAVVRRQPFGGHKASSYGPGAKAGGPNYVLNFCQARAPSAYTPVLDAPMPDAADYLAPLRKHIARGDHKHLASAACAYAHAFRESFAQPRDPSQVLGELNLLRYLPHEALVIRASRDAILGEALLACLAALTAGARPTLSADPALVDGAPWLPRLPMIVCVTETAEACSERLQPHVTRIRAIGPVEPVLRVAAVSVGVHVAAAPIHPSGRIELLHCLREQTLSVAYHRNGSLEAGRLLPWSSEPFVA
jgi:RHH-type transcriptional regulator, proline utilization regulon repressor / proline dehydrogenase / delta 1-pyrroline-5-carboxylate dehydrogenase